MPYIPMTDQNREEMLKAIGVADFEELLSDIPEGIRFNRAVGPVAGAGQR